MREGLIPTMLGLGVTATAATLRAQDMKKRGMKNQKMAPMVQTALLGFGLAHVVLGAIDLVQHKEES